MKVYLGEWFNGAIFTGEIFSSILMVFLTLLTISYFSKNKLIMIPVLGISFMTSFFVGNGIANTIESGATIFALPVNTILNAFFFESYNLIVSDLGAQLIGTLIAIALFFIYKKVFKLSFNLEVKKLTYTQSITKEAIAQLIFILSIFFIAYMTFNNNYTSTNTTRILSSFITIISLTSLLMVFSQVNMFIVSPLISLAVIVFNYKNLKKDNLIQEAISNSIHLLMAIVIGLIIKEVKWW